MQNQDIEQYIAAIATATTNKNLKKAAINLLAALGFTRWIYVSENPYGLLGFPAALANEYGIWIVTYMSKGYMQIDPVVAHCRVSTEPYCWDTCKGWEEADEKVREMMKDAAKHGFGSGVAIPLFMPNEPKGLLNITSPKPLVDSRMQFEEALPHLYRIGHAMHASMMCILKENARYQNQVMHNS